MIENKVFRAVNLNQRLTKIRRTDIDNLFNKPKPTLNKPIELEISNCYSISEIKEKYKVSDNGLRAMTKRNKIPKTYIERFAYYPKKEIDALFSLDI